MPPKKKSGTPAAPKSTDKPAKVEKQSRTATKALASAKVDAANIMTKKRTRNAVDYSDTQRRTTTTDKKKKSAPKKTKKSAEKKTESK
eukprot:gene889-9800_t